VDNTVSTIGWRGAWAEGAPPLRIEFIGKEGMVSDKMVHGGRRTAVRAGDYIEARARAWTTKVEVAVYTDFGHEGAVRHLTSRGDEGVKVVVLSLMGTVAADAAGSTMSSHDANNGHRGDGSFRDSGGGNMRAAPGLPPAPLPPGIVHRAREAVAAGIALVASDEVLKAAGVGEIDRSQLRFEPSTSRGLAARLTAMLTLRGGARRAKLPHASATNNAAAVEAQDIVARWIAIHAGLAAHSERLRGKVSKQAVGGGSGLGHGRLRPRVTVCLVHRNRPAFLRMAVDSLLSQDYDNMDIVVVDNASDDPSDSVGGGITQVEARMSGTRGWHSGIVVRSPTRLTLTGARNLAASKAKGDFLLFMDDDNAALPAEVSILVTAALATGADISAPGNLYLAGTGTPHGATPAGRWIPLGAAISAGVFKDVFGDANALIRRSTFTELGGWRVTKERGGVDSTGEDWELFARAVLRGYTLQAVPYPLFWYRQAPGSMTQTTSLHLYRKRVLAPFGTQVPAGLAGALELAKTLLAQRSDDPVIVATAMLAVGARSAAHEQLLCAMKPTDPVPSMLAAAEMINLVRNHNFSSSASGVVAEWEALSDGYDWFAQGSSSLAMTVKSHSQARGAHQLIHLGQTEATGPGPVLLGARSRAETVDVEEVLSADYSLYADLTHDDGSQTFGYYLPFSGRTDWEWASGIIVPDKPVASVRLYLLFRHRLGTAWFDDAVLRPLTAADVCGAAGKSSGAGVVYTRNTPILATS
jgi:GT2 family glycosyltransferase